MDESKPNYYSIIPAEIRYDPDLPPNAKLLYSEITSLCNKEGYCYASNKYFSKLYKVNKVSISRWINLLVKKGYIDTEILKKEKNKSIDKRVIYIKNIPINKIVNTYKQNCIYPINKNVKENNINNNRSNSNNIEENIFEIIEKEFGRTLSPMEYELIQTWDYPIEILKLAIKESVIRGNFSLKYIDKIIYNWKKANVKSEHDVNEYIKKFTTKKGKNNQSKSLDDCYEEF